MKKKDHIQRRHPGIRGFSPQNIWRMRQFFDAYCEDPKLSPAARQIHGGAASVFKDAYVVEFLNLPEEHNEADLHRGLLARLKAFLIELGRSLSPALIAEYQTQLPDKQLLAAKLQEFYALNAPEGSARPKHNKAKP